MSDRKTNDFQDFGGKCSVVSSMEWLSFQGLYPGWFWLCECTMKQCWQTWYYAGVVLVAGVTGTAGGHMSCPALAVAAGVTVPLLRSRPAHNTHWPPRATPTELQRSSGARCHRSSLCAQTRLPIIAIELNLQNMKSGQESFFTTPVADFLSYLSQFTKKSFMTGTIHISEIPKSKDENIGLCPIPDET